MLPNSSFLLTFVLLPLLFGIVYFVEAEWSDRPCESDEDCPLSAERCSGVFSKEGFGICRQAADSIDLSPADLLISKQPAGRPCTSNADCPAPTRCKRITARQHFGACF